MLGFLNRLFGRKTEPDHRRVLILFDTSRRELTDMSNEAICRLLHRLAVERGLSCSLVSFKDYVYDRAIAVGRFSDNATVIGDIQDEHNPGTIVRKLDIMWLLRHRNRLVREAFAAGGEAEYVFMIFEGEPLDVGLHMDPDMNRKLIRVHYLSYESSNVGAFAVISHDGNRTLFRMKDDNWTTGNVAPILDHIVGVSSSGQTYAPTSCPS